MTIARIRVVVGKGAWFQVPFHQEWKEAIKLHVPATNREWDPFSMLWWIDIAFAKFAFEQCQKYFDACLLSPGLEIPEEREARIKREASCNQEPRNKARPQSRQRPRAKNPKRSRPSSSRGQQQNPPFRWETPRESPYQVLGVPDRAPFAQVKKAFRELAMTNHPDRGGDEERMKKINQAFNAVKLLKDM